jgi:hypothetical protein
MIDKLEQKSLLSSLQSSILMVENAMRVMWVCGVVLLSVFAFPAMAQTTAPSLAWQPSRRRTFFFTYSGTISGIEPGKIARVWLPIPPSDADQQVELITRNLPAKGSIATEPRCGNSILYFEAPASSPGKVEFALKYRVSRREISTDHHSGSRDADALFLRPSALVPVGGTPAKMLVGLSLPADQLQLARVLYDLVDDHMQYRKDKPGWGRGDATWACQSGFGNCTDFHSLFISLARTEKIPSRFEIGFAIPRQRGRGQVSGYHCWAKFKPADHGWVPVDISEASQDPARRDYYFGHLDADRVAFSTGRDIELAPKQSGPPINFFVYPYAEVDNKPWPAEKIAGKFSYEDEKARTED